MSILGFVILRKSKIIVPISTIVRGIEIDLRQNLGESDEAIPNQFPIEYNTQF